MAIKARAKAGRAHLKSASPQPSTLRRSRRLLRSRSREPEKTYVLAAPSKYSNSPSKVPFSPLNEDESQHQAIPHTPTRDNRGGKVVSKSGNNELSPVFKTPARNAANFNTNLTRQNSRRSERSIPESPVDHGNITGTTLLATDSDHESRDMDPSIMVEALPDLETWANNALRILSPRAFSYTNVLNSLGISSFRARVKRVEQTFDTQKRCFGGQHFIPIDAAAEMLPSLEHVPWYPHLYFQKANLAQLALDLIPFRGKNTSFMEDHFWELDELFPTFFISSFESQEDDEFPKPGQSALLAETFKLGLEIRTQLAINYLRSEQESSSKFDPFELLAEVFMVSTDEGDEVEKLRGWQLGGLDAEYGKISDQFLNETHERLTAIQECFVSGNVVSPVDFAKLESAFPWSDFVTQAAKWIRMRVNEIDEELEEQSSLAEALEMLQTEVDRTSSLDQRVISLLRQSADSVAQPKNTLGDEERGVEEPQEIEPTSTRKSMFSIGKGIFKSMASVSHLVNLQTRVDSSLAGSAHPECTRHIDRPSKSPTHESSVAASGDSSTPEVNVDAETPPPSACRSSHRSSSRPLRQSATPSKQREQTRHDVTEKQPAATLSTQQIARFKTPPPAAFIDRQDDAHRLSPIGSSPLSSSKSQVNGRSRKRQASEVEQNDDHVEEEDASSDEEGFEEDNRNIPVERKRASTAKLQSPKRRRTENEQRDPSEERSTEQRASATPQKPSERRRNNRAKSRLFEAGNEGEDGQPSGDATQMARRIRKPGGGRIPWSVDECNQLKKLIIGFGPKWSKIKHYDDSLEEPKLGLRDQVNLKDKARQMSVDFYKAGQPLPENFEKVPLKTEDKRKLRDMGVAVFEDLPDDE
ncbi:hypothetical protein PAAG_03838 [Paracoccidioides lutzii Pb01]|uniref:Myb-like domain-containing protein n=1 Tax=Paracoccidioides lutzii (strain ATCC MYA-826 / Pb01) TaxID=502779 RepID=C1GZ94_PARBA|nr:hypothetical protein PAAG_03838 [Paracoccidioides lutzii Pb01]EEH41917.1 hypothetical protein PAAG_03838 [Paracoccidioides lutzii Pb01]